MVGLYSATGIDPGILKSVFLRLFAAILNLPIQNSILELLKRHLVLDPGMGQDDVLRNCAVEELLES